MRVHCSAEILIQPRGIRTRRRSARSVLASTVCFLSPRSLLSLPEGNGWGSIGRIRKIKYAGVPFHLPCKTHFHKLFARRGNLPNRTDDPWTTFEMELREPTPIPAPFDFTKFLVSSITFMVHLREVSVYFDDRRLVHLTKDAGTPKQLTIPRNLRCTSTQGLMTVKGLKSACMKISHS